MAKPLRYGMPSVFQGEADHKSGSSSVERQITFYRDFRIDPWSRSFVKSVLGDIGLPFNGLQLAKSSDGIEEADDDQETRQDSVNIVQSRRAYVSVHREASGANFSIILVGYIAAYGLGVWGGLRFCDGRTNTGGALGVFLDAIVSLTTCLSALT